MKPVLYAEDDPDDLFFMRHAWDLAGVPNPLVAVGDGQEAINYLAGRDRFSDRANYPLPYLLLLDLKLTAKNGFDVLRWVRRQPGLVSLRVVILSGSNQESDIALARTLGVTDYVIKSSSPGHLLAMLLKNKDVWLA